MITASIEEEEIMNEKNGFSKASAEKVFIDVKKLYSGVEKHITGIRVSDERGGFTDYKEGDLYDFKYCNCSCVLDDGNIISFKTQWYKDEEYRKVFADKNSIDLKGFDTFEEYMKSKGLVAGPVREENGCKWDYRRLCDNGGECFTLEYIGLFFC